MGSNMAGVVKLAKEAQACLERGEREADGIGKILVPRTEDRPAWFQELCHKAHGDMMPDDWRYEFIGDALDFLAQADPESDENDVSDGWHEWCDGRYVYTHEQTAWLHSRADRSGYCDDAAADYGDAASTTLDRIALGMLQELNEVFGSVFESLRELADAEPDEEPAE